MNPRRTAFLGVVLSAFVITTRLYAAEVKQPAAAGSFYPSSPAQLSAAVKTYLDAAKPPAEARNKKIFALISPHAGYEFSGRTAANGYKLIQGKAYRTVVVIGPSHYYGFRGISVYPQGTFRTPLGDIQVDEAFAAKLAGPGTGFEPRAFEREHSVEVQLPFLQTVLKDFRIVPVVMGRCSYEDCAGLASRIAKASGGREDVLVVGSSDLYHGYDYNECDAVDARTLSYIQKMDAKGLYNGIED
ncbi:MAG: AmmeMemoRadiSam system protein B, partial [Deltaproteobacteria bacterium]